MTTVRADSTGLTLIVATLLILAVLMAGVGLRDYYLGCALHTTAVTSPVTSSSNN
jgi:hypothetical protein